MVWSGLETARKEWREYHRLVDLAKLVTEKRIGVDVYRRIKVLAEDQREIAREAEAGVCPNEIEADEQREYSYSSANVICPGLVQLEVGNDKVCCTPEQAKIILAELPEAIREAED